MAAGALLLGGGAIWFFLSPSRLHDSQEAHDLPTIKLAFIPETLKDDDIVFHLTATNANPATIRISRVSYTTGQMFDVEIEKNNKRIVPSGGAIDYPGLPFTGLAKSKRLAVQIEFEYDPHQKATTYTSNYLFAMPETTPSGQIVNPMEWSTVQGTTEQVKSQVERMLATLDLPRATIHFELPEKRPDGSINHTTLSGNNRFFSFDPETKTVTFTVFYSPQSSKSLTLNLIPNHGGNHKVAFSWDDAKKDIHLGLDGVVADFGPDVDQIAQGGAGENGPAGRGGAEGGSGPALRVSISGANVFAPDAKDVHNRLTGIALNARIWNTGIPSVATEWSLVVVPQNMTPVIAQLTSIPETLQLTGPISTAVIHAADALDTKTLTTPIGAIPVEGVLLFYVPLEREIVINPSTKLELTVKDIYSSETKAIQIIGEWLRR